MQLLNCDKPYNLDEAAARRGTPRQGVDSRTTAYELTIRIPEEHRRHFGRKKKLTRVVFALNKKVDLKGQVRAFEEEKNAVLDLALEARGGGSLDAAAWAAMPFGEYAERYVERRVGVIADVYGLSRLSTSGGSEDLAIADTYLEDGLGSVSASWGRAAPWPRALLPPVRRRSWPRSRRPATATGSSGPHHGYNAEPTSPEGGLQYLRARWYDPSMGAFGSRDSLLGRRGRPGHPQPLRLRRGQPGGGLRPDGARGEEAVRPAAQHTEAAGDHTQEEQGSGAPPGLASERWSPTSPLARRGRFPRRSATARPPPAGPWCRRGPAWSPPSCPHLPGEPPRPPISRTRRSGGPS